MQFGGIKWIGAGHPEDVLCQHIKLQFRRNFRVLMIANRGLARSLAFQELKSI